MCDQDEEERLTELGIEIHLRGDAVSYLYCGHLLCVVGKMAYSRWSWWRGTVVERRSLTGELSLSCARPAADG